MIKQVLSFLFGRSPKIFNQKGQVQHDLGEEKWEAWKNKQAANPDYNWRNHSGTQYHKSK